MIGLRRADLESEPTPEQIERFSKLTVEQRFQWLVDMLSLCFELATPEERASWSEHKSGRAAEIEEPK